jgi:poly(3-hydroxybutyrate) depolymerase
MDALRQLRRAQKGATGRSSPPTVGIYSRWATRARPVSTIVFHGDADRTVSPVNSGHVIAQARQEAALTKMVTHGETPGGMAHTRTVQLDAAGGEVLEQWVLHGAGHAWSGGSVSGSYTDARGPDASREMIRFFLANANAKAATKH